LWRIGKSFFYLERSTIWIRWFEIRNFLIAVGFENSSSSSSLFRNLPHFFSKISWASRRYRISRENDRRRDSSSNLKKLNLRRSFRTGESFKR
jgi:hypothetical protein